MSAAWLGTRRSRAPASLDADLRVFSPEEAAVLLAVADRLVPEHAGFPRPTALRLAEKMDGVAALADLATQAELRQLVRLFDNALSGLILDGSPELFTEASPEQQDRRLSAWAESRLGLRRTGYRALKRLVYAAYYACPETWSAVGYPGPPPVAERTRKASRSARRTEEQPRPEPARQDAAAATQPEAKPGQPSGQPPAAQQPAAQPGAQTPAQPQAPAQSAAPSQPASKAPAKPSDKAPAKTPEKPAAKVEAKPEPKSTAAPDAGTEAAEPEEDEEEDVGESEAPDAGVEAGSDAEPEAPDDAADGGTDEGDDTDG